LLQQGRDFGEREPELLVEDHDQRDHLRAELRRGGADRVRCLQRVTPVHASAASGAPPHVQIKLTDDDTRNGELFLILRRNGRFHDRFRAGRTVCRERHVVVFIDPRGN
jgi:hypothetical protein